MELDGQVHNILKEGKKSYDISQLVDRPVDQITCE